MYDTPVKNTLTWTGSKSSSPTLPENILKKSRTDSGPVQGNSGFRVPSRSLLSMYDNGILCPVKAEVPASLQLTANNRVQTCFDTTACCYCELKIHISLCRSARIDTVHLQDQTMQIAQMTIHFWNPSLFSNLIQEPSLSSFNCITIM